MLGVLVLIVLVIGSAGWLELLPCFWFRASLGSILCGFERLAYPALAWRFFWHPFLSACVTWSMCAFWCLFLLASCFSMIPRVLEGLSSNSFYTVIITSSFDFIWFLFSRNFLKVILTFSLILSWLFTPRLGEWEQLGCCWVIVRLFGWAGSLHIFQCSNKLNNEFSTRFWFSCYPYRALVMLRLSIILLLQQNKVKQFLVPL